MIELISLRRSGQSHGQPPRKAARIAITLLACSVFFFTLLSCESEVGGQTAQDQYCELVADHTGCWYSTAAGVRIEVQQGVVARVKLPAMLHGNTALGGGVHRCTGDGFSAGGGSMTNKLYLGMPGSGKTTAAAGGRVIDADYGYFKRGLGCAEMGFIPQLSTIYLAALFRIACQADRPIAVNCPELLADYLAMGFDVRVVVPKNEAERFNELASRHEGQPTPDFGEYAKWKRDWLDLHSVGVPVIEGNVPEVWPGGSDKTAPLRPLSRFVTHHLLEESDYEGLVKVYASAAENGPKRFVGEMSDGFWVLKVFDGVVKSFKVWAGTSLERTASHWNMQFVRDTTAKYRNLANG